MRAGNSFTSATVHRSYEIHRLIVQCEKVLMREAKRDSSKIIIALTIGAYFAWCAYDPHVWHLIDGVDLVIHEAGHVVFHPLGEFLMVAGGSLFQVIVPAVFVGYFYHNKQFYSAALTLFWVGQSLLNVSVYASDAVAMELPLLGGQDSMHDWNYLLDRTRMPSATTEIGGTIRLAGTLAIVAALCLAIINARRERPLPVEN